jgi:hypothetical protein
MTRPVYTLRPIYTPAAPKPARSDILADWVRYAFFGAIAGLALAELLFGPWL